MERSSICSEFYPFRLSQENLDRAFPDMNLRTEEALVHGVKTHVPVIGALAATAFLTSCSTVASTPVATATNIAVNTFWDGINSGDKFINWFLNGPTEQVALPIAVALGLVDFFADNVRGGQDRGEEPIGEKAKGCLASLSMRMALFYVYACGLKVASSTLFRAFDQYGSVNLFRTLSDATGGGLLGILAVKQAWSEINKVR